MAFRELLQFGARTVGGDPRRDPRQTHLGVRWSIRECFSLSTAQGPKVQVYRSTTVASVEAERHNARNRGDTDSRKIVQKRKANVLLAREGLSNGGDCTETAYLTT